jgi:hypothetical protein
MPADTSGTTTPVADDESFLSHPLFDHTVLQRTNPSDELYLAVKRIITVRETGCVFTGQSRIGILQALFGDGGAPGKERRDL